MKPQKDELNKSTRTKRHPCTTESPSYKPPINPKLLQLPETQGVSAAGVRNSDEDLATKDTDQRPQNVTYRRERIQNWFF